MKRLAFNALGLSLCLLVPMVGRSQNKVYNNVSNETVEKVLKSLELKFDKGERKVKDNAVAYYDFKRDEISYRLFNYGSDLWIETPIEQKLKLEDINRWNAQAKFSRAVLIDQKDKASISLEAQIDCLGGVTDAVIKQFVTRFDEETKKFVQFVPKK
jgi:molybdenum cofactor biosynthesis enzyme MoaA